MPPNRTSSRTDDLQTGSVTIELAQAVCHCGALCHPALWLKAGQLMELQCRAGHKIRGWFVLDSAAAGEDYKQAYEALTRAARRVIRADGIAESGVIGADVEWDAALEELRLAIPTLYQEAE